MEEPREPDVRATDKAVPPETLEARGRSGMRVGLVWVGVFVVAAAIVLLAAWLLG